VTRAVALIAVALGLAISPAAEAHGGLPISSRILRQNGGDTLYVPVVYWGVWVGQEGQPWHWICEELINPNRFRHYALSTDGTFYATDALGVTVSTDHGCTWVSHSGDELAQIRTTDVAVDPVDGATAWITTDAAVDTSQDGAAPVDNALFATHDHGTTFTRVPALSGGGRRFLSVRPAPSDAHTLYVVASLSAPPFSVTLYRSSDGGATFTALPLGYTLDGQAPYSAEVMAVDPRAPEVIYLRVFVTLSSDAGSMPEQALLRSVDGGANFAEIWRELGEVSSSGVTRGIDGVAIDPTRGLVLVASTHGVLAADDPGRAPSVTLAARGGLSQAQCVDVHGDEIFACSTNYQPDRAAIARSRDGADSFQSILSYQDTVGPVDCPKGTPVGDQCPAYWLMYGTQLGVANPGAVDGGSADMGAVKSGGGGCGCQLGGTGSPALLGMGAAICLMAALLRRRARR
jgi:hypothetical protein